MENLPEIILSLLLAAGAWFGWKQNKAKQRVEAQLSAAHDTMIETELKHEKEKMKVEDDIYENLKKKNAIVFPKRRRSLASKLASKSASKRK